jgi:ADP-ribosylglycohydrolase
MGTTMKCALCGAVMDSNEGYLRPEGFLCGECYAARCADPSYLADMERQLSGLVSTVTMGSEMVRGETSSSAGSLPEPKTPSERLACESLIGLSIGDALGARWEGAGFDPARLAAVLDPEEGIAPWTDDTQMALSIVEVLLTVGTIDQDRLAAAFGRRYEAWRGYGAGMHAVLPELRSGKDWRQLRDRVFPGGSFGNGSAMRVAPLGAYLHDAPAESVVAAAERSAEVTHAHPEAKAGAVATAVASWLAARSRGRPMPPLADLWAAVCAPLHHSLEVSRGLQRAASLPPSASLADAVTRLGNGARVTCADTVPLALWIAFLHLDDFALAVRHAIAAGGDTDTLAAIVGGIVAARVGVDAIPPNWRGGVEPLPLRMK